MKDLSNMTEQEITDLMNRNWCNQCSTKSNPQFTGSQVAMDCTLCYMNWIAGKNPDKEPRRFRRKE